MWVVLSCEQDASLPVSKVNNHLLRFGSVDTEQTEQNVIRLSIYTQQ